MWIGAVWTAAEPHLMKGRKMRTYTICAAATLVGAVMLGACSDGSGAAGTGGGGTSSMPGPVTAGDTSMPAPGGGSGSDPIPGGAGTSPTPTAGSNGLPGGGSGPMDTAGTSAGGTGNVPTAGTSSGGTGVTPPMGGMGGAAPMGGTSAGGGSSTSSGPFKVLILSTTLEFHHDSIPNCQYMMGLPAAMVPGTDKSFMNDPAPINNSADAGANTWTADLATDDLAQFTDANLKNYAMVFSCSPTGTVFSNNPKVKDKTAAMSAMQKFVEGGGAWGGVHSATDFENRNGFPWFTNTLAGAYFVSHDNDGTPGSVQFDMTNKDAYASVLKGLQSTYATQDEWYKMNRDVSAQPGFKILQRLASDQRPLTWVKEVSAGRMFNTVRGHNKSVFKETEFRKLVLQGVLWATKRLN